MPSESEIGGGYGFGTDDVWNIADDWHTSLRGGDQLFGPSLPYNDFAYDSVPSTDGGFNSAAPSADWYKTSSIMTNGRSYSSRDPFTVSPIGASGQREASYDTYNGDGGRQFSDMRDTYRENYIGGGEVVDGKRYHQPDSYSTFPGVRNPMFENMANGGIHSNAEKFTDWCNNNSLDLMKIMFFFLLIMIVFIQSSQINNLSVRIDEWARFARTPSTIQ
jgi:hypothetical protein